MGNQEISACLVEPKDMLTHKNNNTHMGREGYEAGRQNRREAHMHPFSVNEAFLL